jgi:hypothetical protein
MRSPRGHPACSVPKELPLSPSLWSILFAPGRSNGAVRRLVVALNLAKGPHRTGPVLMSYNTQEAQPRGNLSVPHQRPAYNECRSPQANKASAMMTQFIYLRLAATAHALTAGLHEQASGS